MTSRRSPTRPSAATTFDKAIRVTVGRPSLGAEGVSPRIQVRVDPTLATALRSRARRKKCSVSEISRIALREYLDRAA
jgi:hypothetical protein